MNFLNEKFKTIGQNKFLHLAAWICFICDVSNVIYVNKYFLARYITPSYLINIQRLAGNDISRFPRHVLDEYVGVLISTMGTVFTGFLFYHLFVYFMFSRSKNWARKYVYGYTFTGAILTMFEVPNTFGSGFFWGVIMILTTLAYGYTYLGLRYFKKNA